MKKILLGLIAAFALTTTAAYADDAKPAEGDKPAPAKKKSKKAKKAEGDAKPADAPAK